MMNETKYFEFDEDGIGANLECPYCNSDIYYPIDFKSGTLGLHLICLNCRKAFVIDVTIFSFGAQVHVDYFAEHCELGKKDEDKDHVSKQ